MSLAPKSGIPKPRQVAVDPTWDEVFEILESQLLEQPVPWNQGGNVKIDETSVFSVFMLLSCSCYNVDGVYYGYILYISYMVHVIYVYYI